jgi:RES domain-containing protein
VKRVRRGGSYYRVCGPDWNDPSDTEYSKVEGGRWNPKGEFGALYLNGSVAVARENALRFLRENFGPDVMPEDIDDAFLPALQEFAVEEAEFVDAVTRGGRAELGLPIEDATGLAHARCQAIARAAYRDGAKGVACETATAVAGEELVIFDRHSSLVTMKGKRKRFRDWFSTALAVAARSKKKAVARKPRGTS